MMRQRSRITSVSGILPVALYVKPSECGGKCIFCPSIEGIPNSYIKNEDTTLAKKLGYDSAMQFNHKVKMLCPDLLVSNIPFEIIILGGSFSALSRSYRSEFLETLYNALNTCGEAGSDSSLVRRCSVLTVESRPDQITEDECQFLRKIGVSKVEIGVQHTSDSVLGAVVRGHSQDDVIRATSLLKQNGFKVGYHVMLGLPGSSLKDDCRMLGETLWQKEYHPDYLKIYPCVLLRTKHAQPLLTRLFEEGKWQAPSDDYCNFALSELASSIPPYVRLSRVQRQFYNRDCLDGPKVGLRNRFRFKIPDLRDREAGFKLDADAVFDSNQILKCTLHQSGNDLYFEVTTTSGLLLCIARTLIHSTEIAVLREIKVFGRATSVGEKGQIQGNGLGTSLLRAVEKYLIQRGYQRIKTNAAVGARSFFLKNGYHFDDEYFLVKYLSPYCISSSNQQEIAFPISFYST